MSRESIKTSLVLNTNGQLIPQGTNCSYITDKVGQQELSNTASVFIHTHTHKNVFGSTPHAFKNPSETVKQMSNIWQPLCDGGKDRTKASVFHHTAALLEICLDLIVSLLKSVKAPCSSRFLRKVPLDDTWAEVSSFKGNGERIGWKRWAPLNTTEEEDLWGNQYCPGYRWGRGAT